MVYSELANWDGKANNPQKSILPQYSRTRGDRSIIQMPNDVQKTGGRANRIGYAKGDSRESPQLVKGAVSDAIAGWAENQREEAALAGSLETHDHIQDASTGDQSRLSATVRREQRSYGSEQKSISTSYQDSNNTAEPSATPKAFHRPNQLEETFSTSKCVNESIESLTSTHSVHDDENALSDPNDSVGVVDDMLTFRDSPPPPKNSPPPKSDTPFVTYAGRRAIAPLPSEKLSPVLSFRASLSNIMKRRGKNSMKGKETQKPKSKSESLPIRPRKLRFDCVLIPPPLPTREVPRTSKETYISVREKGHVRESKRKGLTLKQESKRDEEKVTRSSDRTTSEVICIISSSPSVPKRVSACKPATPTPARTTHDDLVGDSDDFAYPHEEGIGDEGSSQKPIIIDLISDSDQQNKSSSVAVSSKPIRSNTLAPKKKVSKRAAEWMKANPEAKKSKGASISIVLPESTSEPEYDAQIVNPRRSRRSQPSTSRILTSSLSPALPATSPTQPKEQTPICELSEPGAEVVSQPIREKEGTAITEPSQSDDVEETAKIILNLILKPSGTEEEFGTTQAASAQCLSQRYLLGLAAENERPSLPTELGYPDVHEASLPSIPIVHPCQPSPGPSSHPSASSVRSGNREPKATKRGTDRSTKKGKLKSYKEDEDEYEAMQMQSDDSIEEDDFCHSCKSRNVYAKMKCTSVVDGWVCPLSFCHKCILVKFPSIVFDAFSVTFVCPRCINICICGPCCKRRGVPTPSNKRVSWKSLGVLLLSEQATQRQQRYGTPSAQAIFRQQKEDDDWVSPPRRRAAYKTEIDVGERWIRAQNRARLKAGKSPGRAFIGAWQDAWGPSPAALCTMEGVDLDVHAADSEGDAKANVLDPNKRYYLGDVQGLRRPFLRVDDLQLPATQLRLRKPSTRARKYSAGAGNSVDHEEQPRKKRPRVAKSQIDVPEFTFNHQESETPSIMSSMHLPTPDDFIIPELQMTPLHFAPHSPVHGEMMGMSHYDHVGAFGNGDAFTFDWERMQTVDEMKPYAYAPYDYPSLSQQDRYDSYAAALGTAANADAIDQNASFAYGYAPPAPFLSAAPDMYNEGFRAGLSSTQKSSTEFALGAIDPVLLAQNASAPLNPHYQQSASSTGLSQEDLERAVRMALATLGLSVEYRA